MGVPVVTLKPPVHNHAHSVVSSRSQQFARARVSSTSTLAQGVSLLSRIEGMSGLIAKSEREVRTNTQQSSGAVTVLLHFGSMRRLR